MLGHSRQSSKLESEDLAFPPSLVGCGRESVAFIKLTPQAMCWFVLELPWCRDHPIFKMKKLSLGEKVPRFKVAQLGLESVWLPSPCCSCSGGRPKHNCLQLLVLLWKVETDKIGQGSGSQILTWLKFSNLNQPSRWLPRIIWRAG